MKIELKKSNGKPLYIQLYDAIIEEITSSGLKSGEKLPSRRALSEELNIAQTTVDNAYKMLQDTGYIVSIPRQGYLVSFKTTDYNKDIPLEIPPKEQYIFSANGIDFSYLNRNAYAKITKDIVYNDGKEIFSYIEKGGEFILRSEISKFLYSFHNIKCSPWQIILGAGSEYLLNALSVLFDDKTKYIMENPCDKHFYYALKSFENQIVTLPFNTEAFDVKALYESRGDILFIEPNGRFPRGLLLTETEKKEILSWANQKQNRYIIENGYEAELIQNGGNSLYNMDTDNKVIYLGSFSRSLCPSIKTSYMVLPDKLLSLWKEKHVYYYSLSSKLEQYILAEFINKGHFTKHYKNMRKIYKEKREYAVECLKTAFQDKIKIHNSTGGSTYIIAEFISENPEDIIYKSRKNGVKIFNMDTYNTDSNPEIKNNKFVIGVGDLSRAKISTGIKMLKESL